MPQYVLFNALPTDHEPTPAEIAEAKPKWDQAYQAMKEAGVLIDNRGLKGTDAATTVRVRDGETIITDGPFAETKEYLAGYFLIEVPDLDTALEYAATIPSAEIGAVEVRPVWG